MDGNANIAVVRAAYAAFGRGDLAGLLDTLSADVEWVHPGPGVIPWAGEFRGHAGVSRFFAGLGSTVEFEAFAPAAFLADGARVVVLGAERARVKRNGAVYDTHWTHAFTLKDGKVTHFREYTDTAAMVAALGA